MDLLTFKLILIVGIVFAAAVLVALSSYYVASGTRRRKKNSNRENCENGEGPPRDTNQRRVRVVPAIYRKTSRRVAAAPWLRPPRTDLKPGHARPAPGSPRPERGNHILWQPPHNYKTQAIYVG